MSYEIRDFNPTLDKNFILTHWFKSRKTSEIRFISIDQATYDEYLYSSILKTLDSNEVRIACSDEDRSIIYAFICFNVYRGYPVIHYIYVKPAFRKFKIASKLVEYVKNLSENKDKIIITYRNKNVNLDHNINFLSDLKNI